MPGRLDREGSLLFAELGGGQPRSAGRVKRTGHYLRRPIGGDDLHKELRGQRLPLAVARC
jgi:hypothetical protein